MTTGMTWIHAQSSCINSLFHILQEEGVELEKNVCLRRANFKHLTLGTDTSKKKREEEKIIHFDNE